MSSTTANTHSDKLSEFIVDGTPVVFTQTTPTVLPTRARILFLSGFQSSMFGNKASQLAAWAPFQRWDFCRFDYRGHGVSGGAFEHFTLQDWLADAEAILQHCFDTSQPVILIGSSMGSWLSYHLAMKYPEKIGGIITIAAAPDFITNYFQKNLSAAQLAQLENTNEVMLPYHDKPVSKRFFDDGEALAIMHHEKLPIHCPVHALHGLADDIAPWQNSIDVAKKLDHQYGDHTIELIPDGDHRLSREIDLQRLFFAIERLCRWQGWD